MTLPVLLVLVGLATPSVPAAHAGSTGGGAETVCVLDFVRADDASADAAGADLDWLSRGLADMLIVTLGRRSDFTLVEREQLLSILAEHERAGAGVVGMSPVERARILQADVLLSGTWGVGDAGLWIRTRLLRVADQTILAEARWEGTRADVLAAPEELCTALLRELDRPLRRRRLVDEEPRLPPTIDVAAAYYRGLGAFEEGDYPGALAHYLEGVAQASDFLALDRAVVRMYVLLDRTEHAVVAAASTATRLEGAGRERAALEFRYAAAEHCLRVLEHPAAALPHLERMAATGRRHEEATGELAAARAELIRSFADPSAADTKRRAKELQRQLAWGLAEEGWWTHSARVDDEPTVSMWWTRGRRDLARAYAASDRIEESLGLYRELLDDFAPLTALPDLARWNDGLRVEAHYMWLRHYGRTGTLLREHPLRDVNALNLVTGARGFARDFADPSIDPRARAASRYDERGHEYFDFACPAGFQLDAVTLRAEVDGLARFAFYVPDPEGWPPRFSFSKRVGQVRFDGRTTRTETIRLPAGTQFFSLGTSWGPELLGSRSPLGALRRRMLGPAPHADIRRWQLTFELSRLRARPESGSEPTAPETDLERVVRIAARDGWEVGAVLRPAHAQAYTGAPRLDVFREPWFVCSLDGDLFLHHRERPLEIPLPATINTPDHEARPSLVRTHAGGLALLWSRGRDERSATRFVSFSHDLLSWQPPRVLKFAGPTDERRRARDRLERSDGIQPTPDGYMMLLEDGDARYSDDLVEWCAPVEIFAGDVQRPSLTATDDGRLWAVYTSVADVLEPYTADDWLCGYYVVDGKRYKHMSTLHVASSRDGNLWTEQATSTFSGQGSGLWCFPLSERSIGIGVQFNGRFMRWFATGRRATLREVRSTLELFCAPQGVRFFAQGGRILSLRPGRDTATEREALVLGVGSRTLYEEFLQ